MNKTLLFDDYFLDATSETLFFEFYNSNAAEVYPAIAYIDFSDSLSAEEKAKQKTLQEKTKNLETNYYFIYCQNKIIGWHCGYQIDKETYFMFDTGILKPYQNIGIYQALLQKIIDISTAAGYQFITSKHHAGNNKIIVPKLKAGFVIKSLAIDIRLGTMVELIYMINPAIKNIYNQRIGFDVP